jgi:peptidoglycan/LPS O-acetylase OafA/YrhL
MSQLDALRFFAVMGVIVTHTWRPDPRIWILGRLPWGELGDRRPERRLLFMRQFYILALSSSAYTTNIYLWHHLHWIGHLEHFWSLAVEEQFYLAWQ